MATTTTNFGWDIPQSTDLVKDGATAIAALGQDIDTALVDLKGGTTGQVLAKASGTDLDYSWATPASGALTLISNNTFSGVSSYSLANNTFTSTYANYLVVVTTSLSNNEYLTMRLRASGTDNTTSNYSSAMLYVNYSGTTSVDSQSSQNSFTRVFYPDAGSNTLTYVYTISQPQIANKTGIYGYGNRAATAGVSSYGFFNDTTSFDSLSLIPLTGTITGKVQVYGYGL